MSNAMKNQKGILDKLKIDKLNPMQVEAQLAIHSASDIMILSPTGSGKTLGFLLPIVLELDKTCAEVQAMIIVPSRELAIQIEQVAREMGTGYKVNCVYGGRSFSKEFGKFRGSLKRWTWRARRSTSRTASRWTARLGTWAIA